MNTAPLNPSVGRIVHYHWKTGTEPLAAIITKVWADGDVNLTVFMSGGGIKSALSVSYSAEPAQDCWSWPVGCL